MRIDIPLAGDAAASRIEWDCGGCMSSLSADGRQRVLGLVAEALRRRTGEPFPDVAVTGLLRETFDADFAGAGDVDLLGTESHRWADVPTPAPPDPQTFHEFATHHPLARAYRRTGTPAPLRLSDVARHTAYMNPGPSRVMTIPLAITSHHICAIAIMRSGSDFSHQDLCLARHLQPILAGIYALKDCAACRHVDLPQDPDIGIGLTTRELAVLDLMADGLIAAAIGRQLGISSRTVSKHIERIYRKLNTHDRTSAVLRGQALGYLRQ